MKEGFGSSDIVLDVLEASPTAIRWKVGRCPDYEGLQKAGLDNKTVECHCRCGEKRWEGLVKQLNPNLIFKMRTFRSKPDDFSEEEIVLTK